MIGKPREESIERGPRGLRWSGRQRLFQSEVGFELFVWRMGFELDERGSVGSSAADQGDGLMQFRGAGIGTRK